MSEPRASAARVPVAVGLAAVVLMLPSLVGCAVQVSASGGAAEATESAQTGEVEPYIVVLDDGAGSPAAVAEENVDAGLGDTADQVFTHAIDAYTAELTPADAADLRADDQVAFVERDRVAHFAQATQEVPSGVRRIFAEDNPALDIDGVDDVRVDADVAVIDSGIADHPDLDVVSRTDCTRGSPCLDGSGVDDNGHGTHVAGTIGAIDDGSGVVGVAPGARLHAVKACDQNGQCLLSTMIAAVDYVTAHADTIEVANMSLAGPGGSAALDQAISGSIDAGVVHVVAAGNSRQDAATFFPGSNPDAITVSAVADSDGAPGGLAGAPSCRPQSWDEVLADFSNYGSVVDIAAPGVCILSTSNDGGFRTMSGTSMAAPHVAGAAAVLASGVGDPTGRDAVTAIRDQLVDGGNDGWVDDSNDGVQEPLLDVSGLTPSVSPSGLE